ncbi:MAG: hypothetical protein ABI678_14415 [Kofleriaceae bacterium]
MFTEEIPEDAMSWPCDPLDGKAVDDPARGLFQHDLGTEDVS